jgi:glutaminase
MAGVDSELVFAAIAEQGDKRPVRVFRDADAALEWCEDQLLARSPQGVSGPKFALTELDLFKGLSPRRIPAHRADHQAAHLREGRSHREGAEAKLFFVVARGTVSVQIKVQGQGDRKKRGASIGPGLRFGEMALLDGRTRSADIVADERVICYGLAVEQLQELAAERLNIMITILGNLTRDFSERLRHANDEISALE